MSIGHIRAIGVEFLNAGLHTLDDTVAQQQLMIAKCLLNNN